MRSAVHFALVAFWTSVPLFAVGLAVSWPRRDLGWPAEVLWVIVVASSAFLTFRAPASAENTDTRGELRWDSESLVYPFVLVLALLPVVLQLYH